MRRMFIPVCPDDFLGGPMGYWEVKEVDVCPFIVSRKEYFAVYELLKVDEAVHVLRERHSAMQAKDLDTVPLKKEGFACAIEVVLGHLKSQQQLIDSMKLLLSTH